METWLITGANRGIGLEYVKQLLDRGRRVIAAARDPEAAEELSQAKVRYNVALSIEQLDTGCSRSISSLADRLGPTPIDVVVNNAGLYGGSWDTDAGRQTPLSMDYVLWAEIHKVNVMGPFLTTMSLLPQLKLGSRRLVVNMSSDLGSITNNNQGQSHAYRSSKAALNMLTKGLSIDLAQHRIMMISMAPGWTKTDLGGQNAEWTTRDSVGNQLGVLDRLTPEDNGKFLNLLGESVPW